MNEYVITYRKPDGTTAERHVSAANHKAAVRAFQEQGLGEPIRVERADCGYADEYEAVPQVGSPEKSAMIALLIGIVVAVGVVVAIWWRRGCPKMW